MSVHFYPPRGIGYEPKTDCQINGEHYGDVTVIINSSPEAVERWNCCGEETVIGEVFDCGDCLEAGIRPHGQDLPPGWIEDTNGFHCDKCAPEEWSIG